jgi:osmoprotectant transport system ATP-binding protein
MLELKGISKSYGGTPALQPTDLSVEPGRTTVLIGPSGCGKSTLLRLMIGLIWPDTGWVRFDGAEITRDNVRALRRRMGYVIQDGGLFPHLTAEGNVTLMARYLGWDRGRIAARLAELAELTQFPRDGLDRYPAQLSGGQRQRVSLMRALMLDPAVLLLDEPLGALDPIIRSELQDDLRHIFQALRKTVVLVTHDIGEAGFFGDVIALMRDGRVVQRGSLDELVQSPADPFVTRFINAQRRPLQALDGDGRPAASSREAGGVRHEPLPPLGGRS